MRIKFMCLFILLITTLVIYGKDPVLTIENGTYICSTHHPNSYMVIRKHPKYRNIRLITFFDGTNGERLKGRMILNKYGESFIKFDGANTVHHFTLVNNTKFGVGVNTWELKQY